MRKRVALVGAGRWGRRLLPPLLERVDVPICCTTGGETGVDWLRREFPAVERTTSLERVLDDESIDAVAIATPIETHAGLVEQALHAGKHVFVEKPLATSGAGARVLAELAARADRVLFVGHVYLYHPLLVELRGKPVRSARLTWRKHGTFDSDLAWNLASHDVSIAHALFDGRPELVEAAMSTPDTARIRLSFAGGDVSIDIDRRSEERAKTLVATLAGGEVETVDLTAGRPLQRELDAFAAAVERREPFPSDAAHAAAVVDTVERIREAVA